MYKQIVKRNEMAVHTENNPIQYDHVLITIISPSKLRYTIEILELNVGMTDF